MLSNMLFTKVLFSTKKGLFIIFKSFLHNSSKNQLIITNKHLNGFADLFPVDEPINYKSLYNTNDRRRITNVIINKQQLNHALTNKLFESTVLKKISLVGNSEYVDNYYFTDLIKGLRINKSICELNIDGSIFGDDEALFLSGLLETNKTLEKIIIHGNNIQDYGAYLLSEALKINSTIKFIDLFSNRISDVGAIGLAEALKINKTIKTFYMHSNQIIYTGRQALAEVRKHNKSIKLFY